MIHPFEVLMMMDRIFSLVAVKDTNGFLSFYFQSLRFGTWQVKFIGISGYKWLFWLSESENMTRFKLKIGIFALKFVAQIYYVPEKKVGKMAKLLSPKNDII